MKKRLGTFSGMRENIRLAKRAFSSYTWQIVLLTVLGFVVGILEGIGINAVIPLLSFIIGTGLPADLDFITRSLQSFFEFLHIPFTFRYILIFIVVLFLLRAVVLFVFTYITIHITAGYEKEERAKLFTSTLHTKWDYLMQQKLGHLETILMTNVRFSAEMLENISRMIIFISGLIIYTVVALNISYTITLFTLALGAIVFFFFKPVLQRARGISRQILDATKDIAHYVNQNTLGIKTVKALTTEKQVSSAGNSLFETLRKLRIKSTLLRSINGVLMQPLSLIFISIVFAFSFKSEQFVFSAFLAVIYLVQRMFTYFQKLQTNLHKINEAAPYLKNALTYEHELSTNAEDGEADTPFTFEKTFAFNNVRFLYRDDVPVLNGVSFEIKKGEMVGLIGPSGSGKTTIVDLALRLFSPDEGTIAVDGKDISGTSTYSWRRSIGYVSQDIFLMNDTIASNIKFYDDTISDDDMVHATKQAHIYDFIVGTKNKFETYIGDRGIMLSAGQRQRIVIARILARKPQFLILDEATSALDNESEVQIQKVIEELRGAVTTLVVAHRLSTIVNSDRLLVLKEGKIIEEGNPKELLKDSNSYFYKTYNIRT